MSARIWVVSVFLAVAAAAFPSAESAHADQMDCLNIQNPDRRNYCLALARNSTMDCFNIQNSDFRSMCLAQVGGNKMDCLTIQDPDTQQQCLSMF
jgi:hypothetical protein